MPAPQAQMMGNIAVQHFRSLAIVHPSDWSQPQGEAGKQYVDAFEEHQRAVPIDPNLMFVPCSNNHYHVTACRDVGDKVRMFLEETSKAVCMSWQQWMMQAQIGGVVVAAIVGNLPSGGLVGPPQFPLAMPMALKNTPMLMKYSKAVLQAFSQAFMVWAQGYSGVLMYPPTFAMCPMPIHPPCPNIPATLQTTGASPGQAMMAAKPLETAMIAQLGDPGAPHHRQLFQSMATAIDKCFLLWLQQCQVQMVMGTGPVPTYAPPLAPAGAVVGVGSSMGTCLV